MIYVLWSPCTHEEADSRMILHIFHAAQTVHQKIMIRTIDTVVVLLAVSVVQSLGDIDNHFDKSIWTNGCHGAQGLNLKHFHF